MQKGANQLVQLKLKSLILDIIHNIEITDSLILNNISEINDWAWFRQLKYELKQNANILMCNTTYIQILEIFIKFNQILTISNKTSIFIQNFILFLKLSTIILTKIIVYIKLINYLNIINLSIK